jgi:hypothetical protein
MVEDVIIGATIFLALVALAYAGRKFNVPHTDIWSA